MGASSVPIIFHFETTVMNSTSEPTRKLKVFLCHASQDKPVVRELYQKLLTEGWIDPWLDEAKLLPGQDWDMEIEKAIEKADVVIVFLSNLSISKVGYIHHELKYVLDVASGNPDGMMFIMPLRLDDCKVPRRLKVWQYADYFPDGEKESAYQRLLQSLKMRNTKRLAQPNQRNVQGSFYRRQKMKMSKLSIFQRIVIMAVAILAILVVGTLAVLLSFRQPQPTAIPTLTYTFPPHTSTKPINTPTILPSTGVPVIDLDFCKNYPDRGVCINSFGVDYGRASDQLAITLNIKDQSIVADLYVKIKRDDLSYPIDFFCTSVINYPDRIYCSGPFIKGGVKVMIYVLKLSDDQVIAQGAFTVPDIPPPPIHVTKTCRPFYSGC